ncbi:spermidine/putrescine ABC transporter ATP-binding protein PotA [Limisalsivibrio acetivorans]|uniref:spermidine/putrescine ABC transporter ATP-binding protein PotA n=1 Tax=Limisalsivibrio acetivorans TaxID=1304888 RepID=UPI0003B3CE22|nr:spermidine/putrescine ABC transporter ATP-binding protein PotA [Limisalsivibrio acetivorans]
MADKNCVVRLRNITKSFDKSTVLRDFSLDVYEGEFLTLIGPSGCGKTTILRMIAGFEPVDEGDIFLKDKRINDLPPNSREVNTVFQSYALFPHMSVFDNVAFGLRMDKVDEGEIAERVRDVLGMVKMADYAERKPHQLSGGQQQRVAIARAAVNNPKILLLDEPLSALDYKLRKQMQWELKQLQRKLGITFIFVTHDQEEALSMSDRMVVMNEGIIEQIGTPKKVYEQPTNLFTARFVGEINVLDTVIGAKHEDGYLCTIEGFDSFVKTSKELEMGAQMKLLLRPEDMRIDEEPLDKEFILKGKIEATTYKGATLDSVIALPNGTKLLASEFFDEEYEEFEYSRGEEVSITWVSGWEVLLPDEGKN